MKKIWRDNGLSIVLFALFLVFWNRRLSGGMLFVTFDLRFAGSPQFHRCLRRSTNECVARRP